MTSSLVSGVLMLVMGAVTSALSVALAHTLGGPNAELNLMGLYVLFLIPAGALLLGGLAGSGCALVAWKRGWMPGVGVLLLVGVGLLVVFGVIAYDEYEQLKPLLVQADGTQMDFWSYYDMATRSSGYELEDVELAEGLGVWGYGFRVLEVGGFLLGGLGPMLGVRRRAYCEACQRYMTTRVLVASPVVSAGAGAEQQAGDEGADEMTRERALVSMRELMGHAVAGEVGALEEAIASRDKDTAQARKAAWSLRLELTACQGCGAGTVALQEATRRGSNSAVVELQREQVPPQVGVLSRVN